MYRLADYDESFEYFNYLNELLDVTNNEILRPLFNLIEQLDDNKHKFGWIGDYDTFLYAQIIPHIQTSFEKLDEQNKQTLHHFIDLFLAEYRKMAAYECSKNTRTKLNDKFAECTSTLQECAIRFLLERESIDFVLVGMRKSSYVNEIMSFLD